MVAFARSNRSVFNAFVGVGILLFFLSIYQITFNYNSIVERVKGNAPSDKTQAKPKPEAPAEAKVKRPTFREIGKKFGTDKVTVHRYHHMYEKYLEPLRDQPLKMLEIGLGCDMSYGPGASYFTWLEYLPNVDLYYIEYDAACAQKWAANTTGATIFTGDQADVPFLKKFKNETGGNFDVIVDDGGHTMKQQKTSLDTLFEIVKPGGLYFVEDLATSYWPSYGGGAGVKTTFMEQVKTSLDGMMQSKPDPLFMTDVFSVDCMKEVCAFSKRSPGETYD